MVDSLKLAALLAFAALIAAMLAGIVATFLLLIASAGPTKMIPATFLAGMAGPALGLSYGVIPALAVGALLTLATRRDERLGGWRAWAAAGLATGAAVSVFYDPHIGVPGPDAPPAPDRIVTGCCFAAAGAAGALMFWETLLLFLPPGNET